jgi:hypothetical protein
MRIQLIRKLAEQLNRVDVSGQQVGAVIDLPTGEAELLVAEGWARHVYERGDGSERAAPRDVSRKKQRKS